ncbi:hypothetical protein XENTR_v10010471 [Xenopus tropicalis]|nr:hypothetical protein XENTR_v10010471 [Xenopus tropicalis]
MIPFRGQRLLYPHPSITRRCSPGRKLKGKLCSLYTAPPRILVPIYCNVQLAAQPGRSLLSSGDVGGPRRGSSCCPTGAYSLPSAPIATDEGATGGAVEELANVVPVISLGLWVTHRLQLR